MFLDQEETFINNPENLKDCFGLLFVPGLQGGGKKKKPDVLQRDGKNWRVSKATQMQSSQLTECEN